MTNYWIDEKKGDNANPGTIDKPLKDHMGIPDLEGPSGDVVVTMGNEINSDYIEGYLLRNTTSDHININAGAIDAIVAYVKELEDYKAAIAPTYLLEELEASINCIKRLEDRLARIDSESGKPSGGMCG